MLDWTTNQIKLRDYFAEKVTFTINGKKDYRSFCGGVVSILTCAIIAVYGIVQI